VEHLLVLEHSLVVVAAFLVELECLHQLEEQQTLVGLISLEVDLWMARWGFQSPWVELCLVVRFLVADLRLMVVQQLVPCWCWLTLVEVSSLCVLGELMAEMVVLEVEVFELELG